MLGLLPGAGGTYRLPRVPEMTMDTALTLMMTGKQLPAVKAKKMKIVDALVDPLGPGLETSEIQTIDYLKKAGIMTVKDLISGKTSKTVLDGTKNGLKQKLMSTGYAMDYIAKQAKKSISKPPLDNYPAPPKIIEVGILSKLFRIV